MKQTQIQQQKKRKWLEPVIHGIFLILGLITVGFVLLISIYLIVSGIPAIRKIGLIPFLFGRRWESTASEPSFGILPFILTSIYGTAGAVCLGVPVGFFTAVIWPSAPPPESEPSCSRPSAFWRGFPPSSTVWSACWFLCQFLHLGTSLLAGALTLVIMNLPTVMRTTQESLKTVPQSYREGAFGLGAGKWRVIRTLRQKLGDCGSRIETVRHVGYRWGAKV